jgi:hypothetical protein
MNPAVLLPTNKNKRQK